MRNTVFVSIAASVFMPAAHAAAQDVRFTDPATIDALVQDFTGQPAGAPGGARAPVDRRLRLALCPSSMAADWHGTGTRTVAVTCGVPNDVGGWRIFVPLNHAGHTGAAQARLRPAIERGQMVTIAIEGRGFSVQQQGEAMEHGGIGEWVQVRIGDRRGASIQGRVERPGLVVIPAK